MLRLALFVLASVATLAYGQAPVLNPTRESSETTVPKKIDFSQLPLYLQELLLQTKKQNPFGPSPNNPTGNGMASLGMMGWPGIPGKPGVNGHNGLPGLRGQKGERGETGFQGERGPVGPAGFPGLDGSAGQKGAKGDRGEVSHTRVHGQRGHKGEPGPRGPAGNALWKQCAWMEESDLDSGLIKNCTMQKSSQDTSLRVAFSGNLRVGGCTTCCIRWFFTFNGQECSKPLTIDAAFFVAGPAYQNPLRPRYIEGYCDALPAGPVIVGFNVSPCRGGHKAGDAYTGWNSASRIIIEEVPAPLP